MMKGLCAALALAASGATAFASTVSATTGGLQPVACPTTDALYELLNAADRHDVKETARLVGPVCEHLARLHYTVEETANGIATIRVFARDGDWATSRRAYTLDEMTGVD